MRLLIEFYHKNILENMVAALGLTPDIIMFYFDPDYFTHTAVYNTYLACKKYIPHLKLEVGTYGSMDYDHLEEQLFAYIRENTSEEIIVDITGGNELTAVAAYRCSEKTDITLVYSDIRGSRIVNINKPEMRYGCHSFEIGDIIEAAGGKLVSWTDDDYLEKNKEKLYPMAEQILRNVNTWSLTCSYFQKNGVYNRENKELHFEGKVDINPKTHKRSPDEHMMRALARSRIISRLYMKNDRIEFDFRDRESMGYLASFGVWLEIWTYYALKKSGRFHDVKNSVKVDWNRNDDYEIVGNEIDDTAMFGCVPVVISCKMSENSTDADAVNEIYTVSHRVSRGHVIRALVTFSDIKERHSGIYLKAREMGIIVMDRSDILHPDFPQRLERAICEGKKIIR